MTMTTTLQETLQAYIDKKGFSVAALERKAGLKLNVLRNILKGQSKKPTAETLQGIASAIGCSVEDLLQGRTETTSEFNKLVHSPTVGHPILLQETLKAILDYATRNKLTFTVQQTLYILEETYAYFAQKTPPQIDKDFIEWFIKKNVG
jgi:transcriptional regulator with XRE-family HTH domain